VNKRLGRPGRKWEPAWNTGEVVSQDRVWRALVAQVFAYPSWDRVAWED
jgi:hypothetical protein